METRSLRLCLVALNQTPLDWRGNMQRIRGALRDARGLGAHLVLFPELAVSGYGCEDCFLNPDTARRSLSLVEELAGECGDEVVLLGLPLGLEDALYNGVAVLNRGKIRGVTLKSHLAKDGIHYEPRWFKAWPVGERSFPELGGNAIPAGTLTYHVAGLTFGLEICEDAWVKPEQRPCRFLEGVSWVFNASASHFSLRKADIREEIVRESSEAYGIGYAYANLVGCESGRAIYDGELLVAEKGVILSRSDRLYLGDWKVLAYDIRFEPQADKANLSLALAPDARALPELPGNRVRHAAELEVEFLRAATLALFDYMRKSRARGFTVSLSGGVDSGAVAVLVWAMARRMLRGLTPSQRRERFDYFPDIHDAGLDDRGLVRRLLTTVYQATRNSGPVTRRAASALAHAIGARHLELDVDRLVEGYKDEIGEALGRALDWETDDIALQNIQARVRGPGAWMLANLNRSLLLSTSNRSEVAVGYATMDGDTCGGLAPIAGVEKSFLRKWLRLMEVGGIPDYPAIPELRLINEQQPTAELRPPDQSQEDEKDLMPYEVLDALERAIVARRKTPVGAFEEVAEIFHGQHTREQIYQWTKKFCRLFAISQWKRERFAPAFHLDDRNLDPKTWARYPILSGDFEVELEDLDRYVRDRG